MALRNKFNKRCAYSVMNYLQIESLSLISAPGLTRKHCQAYLLSKGAEHSNFRDFPLFKKNKERLGYWGSIPTHRMLELEQAYIKGFFDRHVKGENKSVPEGPSTGYPDVILIRKYCSKKNIPLSPDIYANFMRWVIKSGSGALPYSFGWP